jgi:hypothetical protein
MIKPSLWLGVVGGLVAAAGGCGPSAGAGIGGSSNATEFFAQYCDIYRPCCQAAGLRSDGQACRALYGALVPGTAYDPVAGQACLTETRAGASQPGFCEGNGPDAESCNRVFPPNGTKAPGDLCSEDRECAASTEGDVICESGFISGGAVVEKCQIQIRGVAGSSPCLWTVDGSYRSTSSLREDVEPRGYLCYVSDGLRCDGGSGACVALQPLGGSCFNADECVKGSYCSGSPSTCMARKTVGGTCGGADSECVTTAYCASTLMCEARSGIGTTCTESAQCTSGSCVNGKCDAGSGNFALAFLCGQP